MRIETYSFGRMVIDGEEYQNDLMICGSQINRDWVRKSGHLLEPEDLEWIVEREPDLLIVGKGSTGKMKVSEQTRSFLKDQGIDIWLGRTGEAVDHFNSIRGSGEPDLISAAFHLTC